MILRAVPRWKVITDRPPRRARARRAAASTVSRPWPGPGSGRPRPRGGPDPGCRPGMSAPLGMRTVTLAMCSNESGMERSRTFISRASCRDPTPLRGGVEADAGARGEPDTMAGELQRGTPAPPQRQEDRGRRGVRALLDAGLPPPRPQPRPRLRAQVRGRARPAPVVYEGLRVDYPWLRAPAPVHPRRHGGQRRGRPRAGLNYWPFVETPGNLRGGSSLASRAGRPSWSPTIFPASSSRPEPGPGPAGRRSGLRRRLELPRAPVSARARRPRPRTTSSFPQGFRRGVGPSRRAEARFPTAAAKRVKPPFEPGEPDVGASSGDFRSMPRFPR